MTWDDLLGKIEQSTGSYPEGLHTVLFLIGIREAGVGPRKFSKSEKELLMHNALCRVMSTEDFYERDGVDEKGWPRWKNVKKMRRLNVANQEMFIRERIIAYFRQEMGW